MPKAVTDSVLKSPDAKCDRLLGTLVILCLTQELYIDAYVYQHRRRRAMAKLQSAQCRFLRCLQPAFEGSSYRDSTFYRTSPHSNQPVGLQTQNSHLRTSFVKYCHATLRRRCWCLVDHFHFHVSLSAGSTLVKVNTLHAGSGITP